MRPSVRFGFKHQPQGDGVRRWDIDRDKKAASKPREKAQDSLAVADAKAWEQRLAADGLAALDWDLGGGCIGVSERGGGKLHDEAGAVEGRRAREEYSQLQRDVLEHHRFRRTLDRRVWELHATGMETPRIGRELGITQWAARQSIASTLAAWRARREQPTEEAIDPAVGAALSEALRGCTDLDEAFERARAIPELADYLEEK